MFESSGLDTLTGRHVFTFNRMVLYQVGLLEFYDTYFKHTSGTAHIYDTFSYTGLFISPSGISELDCATTNTDTAERSISIGRESLQVFFVLGALEYFQVPPLGGSRD